ncbi:MAG: polysaccharide biosynthesis protein, partial [Desulfurococcales archaeon]|nr:polysaccharide biosynthesis protein [Desulfurococcales archaeon]
LGATPILAWEEQKRNYPEGIVVGPIYEPPIYEARDEGFILVTTGTLGLPRLYKVLARLGLDNIIVQSGDIPVEEVKKINPRWRVFQYTPGLARLIARASIVITHFPGMTAVTARLAYRKPVVLVQSWRHKLSADPREGPLLAEKLRVPYIKDLDPRAMAGALEEARSLEPPSYPDGALRTAGIIVGEYKRF